MNFLDTASSRMTQVQKVFLKYQVLTGQQPDPVFITGLLDAEPPLFRSVAYEAASMEIGLKDIEAGNDLTQWKLFRQSRVKEHALHIDIGLGWALAKTETDPAPYTETLNPILRGMVFDGIGYYSGLFRGRQTIKGRNLPAFAPGDDISGFDQGLGRRLWYTVKGEAKQLLELLDTFPAARHPDLWRGVGIACGYVGGNSAETLDILPLASGKYNRDFRTGILLAALSRLASGTVTADIETSCRIITGKSLKDIEILLPQMIDKLHYLYKRGNENRWIAQLDSVLEQGN